MIHRRPYGEPVRPGINLSANEHYADLIIATPIISLYLRWDKARRRPFVNAYRHFGWPPVIGPWRRIRELEAEVRQLDHALHMANDRYDKIRETNLQLRDALSLYRNA